MFSCGKFVQVKNIFYLCRRYGYGVDFNRRVYGDGGVKATPILKIQIYKYKGKDI